MLGKKHQIVWPSNKKFKNTHFSMYRFEILYTWNWTPQNLKFYSLFTMALYNFFNDSFFWNFSISRENRNLEL